MLRVLRITLMWLIALAVPVQGSAAVTMFGCGPAHHGGTGSSQMATAGEHARDADHHSREPVADGTAQTVAKANCTPCASCCVVAALPATAILFEPVRLVDFFVLSVQSGVDSFLADGLERPPRSFLA